jgi:hypothetical protein
VERREILQAASFGERIAEQELDELAEYFVETDQWRRLYAGDVDIVYGPKGSMPGLAKERAAVQDHMGHLCASPELRVRAGAAITRSGEQHHEQRYNRGRQGAASLFWRVTFSGYRLE